MKRLLPEDIEGEYPDVCEHAFGHEPGRLAIVVGRGPNVLNELDHVRSKLDEYGGIKADYLAINEAGITLPSVQHWGSIHGDKLHRWLNERLGSGRSDPAVVIGNFIAAPNDDRISKWRVSPYPGSSGLFMTRWALFWGYRRIVLCGIPLEGHDGILPDGSLNQDRAGYHVYRDGWEVRENQLPLVECVRSMSGWTRKRYGAPDEGFLRGVG